MQRSGIFTEPALRAVSKDAGIPVDIHHPHRGHHRRSDLHHCHDQKGFSVNRIKVSYDQRKRSGNRIQITKTSANGPVSIYMTVEEFRTLLHQSFDLIEKEGL